MVRCADRAAAISGLAVALAFASNAVNNLLAGRVASATVGAAHRPQPVIGALLIGVDPGPNLSVTGSLAAILWVAAIRREGQQARAMKFLAIGACARLSGLARRSPSGSRSGAATWREPRPGMCRRRRGGRCRVVGLPALATGGRRCVTPHPP
ncbi:hypothetical protein [Burkholderia sp. IMCC1007]|uniref:hypothetical protein n=1 Tax=Burkholderia sp. IMCC1007 TaxID=3004104 RepID=UPI003FA4432C